MTATRFRRSSQRVRLASGAKLGELDLAFRTKGQLAIDICTAAYADGTGFDFACGDEVYSFSP